MRPLPLNLLTLYADLVQNMPDGGPEAASISRRLEGGKRRLYASVKDGAARRQVYIGTEGDARAEAKAAAHRRAAEEARGRRRTVSLLKRGGVQGPDLIAGRVLETLSAAGLFDKGAVLIGTAAFQLYAPIVGATLSSGALTTQDADIAVTRLAAPRLDVGEDLDRILKRADPSFEPVFKAEDKLPKEFRSRQGFSVELVTTKGRSPEPMAIKALGCAAVPLAFLDYLVEEPIDIVALYNAGVRVRAPDPARYAVHKLIVAQERRRHDLKSLKDLAQARDLKAALDLRGTDLFADAAADAAARGRSWKTKIERGLKLLERG